MGKNKINKMIMALSEYGNELYNKDFLLTWKKTDTTIRSVLSATDILREFVKLNISSRVFDTGLGLSIFRDNSTRTRYSFRSGCNLLGLMTEELNEQTSQIAHGETVRETATMISFLSEVIGIRDDMFLGEGHKYMKEVSDSVQESYDKGILMHRPSVINLQCDLDHPTQSLADLSWLVTHFGSIDAMKGKRLAMTWAYSPSYGKPLSVPQGIVALMTRFGMEVVLAHPKGYDLVHEPIEAAKNFAKKSSGSFKVVDNMAEAFEGADIVYPKSWAPHHVMEHRTRLLKGNRSGELAELEEEALANNAKHKNWECNDKLMKKTKAGQALYMHCLPADVSSVSCKSGEVSESVFNRYRLDTYREASYKPFVIAAMILFTRFKEPAKVLQSCLERSAPRRSE